MPARGYAGYGSALRIAAAVSLAEYDRRTLCAFIADLFRKEISDVERDLASMPEVRRRNRRSELTGVFRNRPARPWSPTDDLLPEVY